MMEHNNSNATSAKVASSSPAPQRLNSYFGPQLGKVCSSATSSISTKGSNIPRSEVQHRVMESWELDPRTSAFQPPDVSIRTAPDISSLSFGERASSTSSLRREDAVHGVIEETASNQGRTSTQSRSPSTPHSLGDSVPRPVPFPSFCTKTPECLTSPQGPDTPHTSNPHRKPSQHKAHSHQMWKQEGISLSMGRGMALERPEEVGRYLMISQVPKNTSAEQLQAVLRTIANHKLILTRHLRKGCVFVTFFDPREALKMYKYLMANPMKLEDESDAVQLLCMRVQRDVVEKETAELNVDSRAMWEFSEAIVVIEVIGGYEVKLKDLENILTRFGDVMWTQEVGQGRKFIVEFFDTRQASYATKYLDGLQVNEARFMANFQPEDVFGLPPGRSRNVNDTDPTFTLGSSVYKPGAFGRLHTPRTRGNSDSYIGSEHVFTPRTYSSTTPSTRHGTPITPITPLPHSGYQLGSPGNGDHSLDRRLSYPGNLKITPGSSRDSFPYVTSPRLQDFGKGVEDSRGRQGLLNNMDIVHQGPGLGGYWDSNDRQRIPEQNRVIPERIISGLDPRTTVMVKDVPNKLSRQELVNILNEVVPGGFDFVYLRFDFNNCCNVGYAFVNFTSVKSLYEFIVARVGKKWNLFSSEKVLQLSYANIQGKSALINKFRNSAVMTVIDQWRPQIFYSGGALQGLPEPFPEPDNLAQRQRSSQLRLSALEGTNSSQYPVERDIYDYDYAPSMLERGF